MHVNYPTTEVPATPEYVLEVFRDYQRLEYEMTDLDADELFTFETTVYQWQIELELAGWRGLGRALNEYWKLPCTDDEWREVLQPAKKKRLRGVCELIARHATRPRVRPATIAGSTCDAAGAFLSIRSMLASAGIDIRGVAPSTPLVPYVRRHRDILDYEIRRLAPGALPFLQADTPVQDAGMMLAFWGAMRMFLGWGLGLPWATLTGLVSFAVGIAIGAVPAGTLFRSRIEFGELTTFRELAIAVAEGNRRWSTAVE